MLLVGLTGGLASGKSTVAAMLARRGAVVVDADDLARRAVARGTPGLRAIVETFGEEVLSADGELDRAALGERVFDDPSRRRALEAIVHPQVFRLLAEVVDGHRDTEDIVVFDAPLIVETGFDAACDLLVVVDADEGEQVRRATARDLSEDQARARIASQAAARDRRDRADIVVNNRGDLDELERRVYELWKELRRRARPERPI